jgi:tetrapyrrole methylase family protein/MazG family protein
VNITDVRAAQSTRTEVVVVGLGPAGPELVTAETLALIASQPHRYLRTARHPAASVVAGARSFDDVYENAATLDEVYPRIVDEVVAASVAHGSVLYAVPGSPLVAEQTVALLLDDDRVTVTVYSALSFLDLAWARLCVDPVASGIRIIDGHRFEVEAAGERGPLLVAQCDSRDVLTDIKLAIAEALEAHGPPTSALSASPVPISGRLGPDLQITVVQRLGLADEAVFSLDWDELDRQFEPDHLTLLWIPAYAAPVAAEVQRFAELVRTLRHACPWDREQTHASLRRHLIEESYEVLDALDHLDPEAGEGYEHLEEELGDLLFQIVFHATLAAEEGRFTLADVARGVHDKLCSRHPHVFGDGAGTDSDQVVANWEQIKKVEKGRQSVFDGIPAALPALAHATKVQGKAGSAGVAEGGPEPESLADLMQRAERQAGAPTAGGAGDADGAEAIGRLLFAVVDLARGCGVDPELALRATTRAYVTRARMVEITSQTD